MAKEITQDPVSKKCGTQCPNCGADEDNVEWGEFICDKDVGVLYQGGFCIKCGCHFKMYFDYTDTEFYMEQCDRVPCPYPMSRFYNTMDEVPGHIRLSTPEDCEKCSKDPNVGQCENSHCLISNVKPDYARDLYFAAEKVIQHDAPENLKEAGEQSVEKEALATAVYNYEGSIK